MPGFTSLVCRLPGMDARIHVTRPDLPVAVDDSRAVEVVWRQLAAHTVAGKDADAKAAHLAGDVTEHDVLVVELHAEHRVREGFDDFALEFDFLFLGQ
jgi:heme-degrading monooxygenase HmoA